MIEETSVCSPSDALQRAPLLSCLRSRPDSTRRNRSFSVSFPEDEVNLITGYLEPANPWEYENVTREDLITNYKASCEKHGTSPLSVVVEQLEVVNINVNRSEHLNLKGAPLAAVACESLEEVLKRIQFRNINLEGTALDDEGSVALFDMIEYYESATHLNISGNRDIAVRGWQACSRMIKKTRCLEQLEARNVTLNEQYMPILSRALKLGTQLQVLKLENCCLSGRPTIILVAALKLNTGLRELYLADNNLNVSDAVQLGAVLRSNQTLQLLDISNNQIQDAGVGHILDGLVEQTSTGSGCGLCILVLWNNHLTRNAAKHFARALTRSTSLEMLNVGHNVLTNESLHVMKDSLQQNRTLLRLGMQSTHLSCEGAIALAECIADNTVIQRIDLRDNHLQVAGLMALSLSMKVNRSVSQLDLDDVPKRKLESCEAFEQYNSLITEIRSYCLRNEQSDYSEEEPSTAESSENSSERSLRVPCAVASRKISLTCETLMRSVCIVDADSTSSQLLEPRRISGGRLRSPAPSPVPSPVSSPIPSPSRTRFQVSRVAEPHSNGSPSSGSSSPFTPPSVSPSPTRFFASPSTSRFRVTLVEPNNLPTNPLPPKPVMASPSGSNITIGFTFKLNDKNMSPRTSPEGSKFISPATSDDQSSLAAVSKLSESLAMADSNSEECNLKESTETLKDNLSNITPAISASSLSVSVSSLEDSADLEVRQIMDRHDNQDTSSKLSDLSKCINFNTDEPPACSSEENQRQDEIDVPDMSSLPRGNENLLTDPSKSKETIQRIEPSSPMPLQHVKEHDGSENVLREKSENTTASALKSSSKTVNQRIRKISWIAPPEPAPDQKPASSLEKLLGLFHHPASFFSKAQPQYKATTVIVNQQPVANSNASFLLTAGPLAEAAQEARLGGARLPSSDPLEEDEPTEDSPVPDTLNNNSSSDTESCSSGGIRSSISSSSSSSSSNSISKGIQSGVPSDRTCPQCTLGEKEHTKMREDENFNVSKNTGMTESSSSGGEKLWCATLSSVCGASVMSWTQPSSTSPESGSCASRAANDETTVCSASCDTGFRDAPVSGEESASTATLYKIVTKSSPGNGVNVPVSSSSIWTTGSGNCCNLIPITNVRLVGGGDVCPEAEGSHRDVTSTSHALKDPAEKVGADGETQTTSTADSL